MRRERPLTPQKQRTGATKPDFKRDNEFARVPANLRGWAKEIERGWSHVVAESLRINANTVEAHQREDNLLRVKLLKEGEREK